MPGIGPHEGFLLAQFGSMVRQGFGHIPYHVGSSLTLKKGWRDVDVRLILPDDEFAAYFGDATQPGWNAPAKNMWDFAWTCLGRKVTGLPIDFQIQPMFEANGDEHCKGPRSALFVTSDHMAHALKGA